MTPEQQKHIEEIASTFSRKMSEKYRLGAEEHGGDLWKKKGIIDFAIEEATDLVVYLYTLKSQLDNKVYYNLTKEDDDVGTTAS